LRVATPLFYHTVVFRSKGQAKALAETLVDQPLLGQFIRQLRVEGRYGAPMHAIIKCSPNILDIFLSLDITSSDNTGDLCKGLHLLNPQCVVLGDVPHPSRENRMFSDLFDTLLKVLPKWDRLVRFLVP
ncbi:hypothetical protein B0H17DRAFT_836127, partial [Mycena rosella]